uniref:Uncharacterized protein n=1 Tax=viral metagenome TaxID=1070528 RepID=A0A6C0H116_9ZZZZ
MNVVEKFLEKFNKCIILLSGFEKLNLSEYAKNLADNLSFDLIKFDYPNYDLLNSIVDKSNNGIVIYGLTFENDQLKFKPNIHISLSGSKMLIDNEEIFKIYNENIKKNIINKFKNIKNIEYDNNTYDDIFNLVIDMILRRLYGNKYDEMQKKYIEKETSTTDELSDQSGGKKKRNKTKRVIGTRLLMSRIKL